MTETFEATFFITPPQKKKKTNLYRTIEINQLELQLTRAHLESF